MTRERRFAREAREARAAAIVERAVARLPRAAALALGRGLGRLWSELDARHVRIAADNLRRSFPHWDEQRVLRTARAVYAHFGAIVIDLLWLGRRTPREILALVDVVGREHALAAVSGETGALFLTGHFGNWELGGIVAGHLFGGIGVVARPLDNPALDARLCAFRALTGNSVIYKQRALQQVLRSLRERRSVAILIDQNVQAGGVFVDFFGRPAATTTVAAALAIKTSAPIVPAFSELLPGGRYRLRYERPIRQKPSGDRRADVLRLTQQLTGVIEAAIRERPEQWLWLHRRWKTQADAAPPFAPNSDNLDVAAGLT
jgi:KDO2-lipid IV(A) lauroyltransferase